MKRELLLDEASDLGRVCRPRELRTAEVFEPNAFYGNDLVLKRYAGLDPEVPLKVVVPHGIVFDRSYVWEYERLAPLPAVLAYSGERAHAYARATRKRPIRAAVPFAYLPRLLGETPPGERAGTLFFPGHSSHRATAQSDFTGMADALERLPAQYGPVTVCLYWRDYELGRHRPFQERGLRVVSAGHIYDPAFLFRLFHLCQCHRYAASNHVGSSLLYSVLAGCRFFMLHGFGVTYTGSPEHLASDLSEPGDLAAELARAFAVPEPGITPRQRQLATEVCGLDHLRSPAEMRGVLAMAERLDRFSLARAMRLARGARRWAGAVARRARA